MIDKETGRNLDAQAQQNPNERSQLDELV